MGDRRVAELGRRLLTLEREGEAARMQFVRSLGHDEAAVETITRTESEISRIKRQLSAYFGGRHERSVRAEVHALLIRAEGRLVARSKIVEETGADPNVVGQALHALCRDGFAIREGRALYRVEKNNDVTT